MIDKKLCDKNLQIEVSCGNAGNSIDGQLMSSGPKASGHDTDSVASGPPDECKCRGVAPCEGVLRGISGLRGLRKASFLYDNVNCYLGYLHGLLSSPSLKFVCDAPSKLMLRRRPSFGLAVAVSKGQMLYCWKKKYSRRTLPFLKAFPD